MSKPITLTLAHSPDPDDVFMWWPITGMVPPPPNQHVDVRAAKLVSEDALTRRPVIDTGRFRFISVPADIDVLNRYAIESSSTMPGGMRGFDITAISINTYPRVKDRYALTSFGSSMGFGYGPKVVVRDTTSSRSTGAPPSPVSSPSTALLSAADREFLTAPSTTIAVPGTRTTAFLLLSMLLGKDSFKFVEMPFDEILPAVAERKTDAGLLIHQSQLTFAEMGLRVAVDIGAWWLARTQLPLPLGGNAVRRDLDARFGPGTTQEVVDLLFASLQYAMAHREESLVYSMGFAPELTREQTERYIQMYVNDLTVDACGGTPAGDGVGEVAIRRLLGDAHAAGLSPDPGEIALLKPR